MQVKDLEKHIQFSFSKDKKTKSLTADNFSIKSNFSFVSPH